MISFLCVSYEGGFSGHTTTSVGNRTHRYHQPSCPLPQVLPACPRDPSISVWYLHLTPATRVPVAKVQRIALAVDTLPDDGVRQPALLQILFCVEMSLHDRCLAVAREHERRIVYMLDADSFRSVDSGGVTLDSNVICDRRIGDDEELVPAFEGNVECLGFAKVALAYLDSRLLDFRCCTGGIVQRDDDVRDCKALLGRVSRRRDSIG